MKPEKHKHTYGKLRRILRFLRPYLFLEFAIFVFMIIVVALSLLDPIVLMFLLDKVLIEGQFQNLNALNIIILALIGLFVIRAFLNVINNYLYAFIGQRILFDIRLKLFRHLEKLHLDFLDFLVLVFYFNSSFFDRFSTAKLRHSDLTLEYLLNYSNLLYRAILAVCLTAYLSKERLRILLRLPIHLLILSDCR